MNDHKYDTLAAIAAIIGMIGLILSFGMLCINIASMRQSLEKIEHILEQNSSI